MPTEATPREVGSTEGLGQSVPSAWIGPVGQTMTHLIYESLAPVYPDDAKHFAPLYSRASLDAAVAAERERWHAWVKEAVHYVGRETWSPSLQEEGERLLGLRA